MDENASRSINGELLDMCENKENLSEEGDNSLLPSYLNYEDFTHSSLGLETYADGIKHPVELKKILTGELGKEMSVSYRNNADESFRLLTYQKENSHGVDIFDSSGRKVTSQFVSSLTGSSNGNCSAAPKPAKLFKSSGSPPPPPLFSGQNLLQSWQTMLSAALTQQDQEEADRSGGGGGGSSLMADVMSQHSAFGGAVAAVPPAPRRPGRPPTQAGTFDPETGSLRYICRLQCGASLASAKGRRKHEKKHCPNLGKVAPAALLMKGSAAADGFQLPLVGHGFSLESLSGLAGKPQKKLFPCRICGKVMKTYEGRRIHEKMQHTLKNKAKAAKEKGKQPAAAAGEEKPAGKKTGGEEEGAAEEPKNDESLTSQEIKEEDIKSESESEEEEDEEIDDAEEIVDTPAKKEGD